MKIAVQLYSVRDCIETAEDMLRVLGEVKAMGYDGVEFAGYKDIAPEVLKARLDELGLAAVGTHIGHMSYAPENIEETIKTAKALGLTRMGVGGAPHDTVEGLMSSTSIMSYGAARAAKEGITVYYHNHTHEFEDVAGVMPIDIFNKACALELDTYWSYCAGIDNYSYIVENKDNICLPHVKDGIGGHPKALGEGDCDVKAVVRAAKDAGIEWLVVENDNPTPNGLDDIARSMKYLKSIL